MPVIQIPFPKSPSNVSVSRGALEHDTPNGVNTNVDGSHHQSPVVADHQETALKTLATIDSKLQAIRQSTQAELSVLKSQLQSAATQIAQAVIGSENELIEKQVTHFAETLLQELEPTISAVFFVHPDCVKPLQEWMTASDHNEINIQADATIAPGDCRIESGDKGLLASMDAFLAASANRLNRTREI